MNTKTQTADYFHVECVRIKFPGADHHNARPCFSIVRDQTGATVATVNPYFGDSHHDTRAIANLLANAPKLYAACLAIYKALDFTGPKEDCTLAKQSAAICEVERALNDAAGNLPASQPDRLSTFILDAVANTNALNQEPAR